MLRRLIRAVTPETLKNRILLSFLLFLLTPIATLALYNFKETERLLQRDASAKNIEQLQGLKTSLVDLMSLVMKTGLLLEQDSTIRQLMRNPKLQDPIERKRTVENKFGAIENTFFLTGATVYYTVIDMHGNAYTSYTPKNALNYGELMVEPWVRALRQEGGERYTWNPNDQDVAVREVEQGREMLSLYEVLRDEGLRPFAYARLSIDYQEWFERTMENNRQQGTYYLLDSDGSTILHSDGDEGVPSEIVQSITASRDERGKSYSIVDKKGKSLYTFDRIQELDGYLVKKVPLALLFKEVDKQRALFFAAYSAILLLFVALTYFISSKITRRLKLVQQKMDLSVKRNLKEKLPEEGRGEVLSLALSFNAMIDDLNGLMEKLRLEERQKQLVRFQVLLAQMNPHFLLNTLNTIKSIALDKDEDEIFEICVALGKILETTLDTDVDLILLKDELVLIESYMDIQRRRFGHGISLRYEMEDDLRYALIPKFCLQPLVENALLHGFGRTLAAGEIEIRAAKRNGQLILEVEDNGVGVEQTKKKEVSRKRKSIGLQNIRESLELMFKNQSTGLAIESSEAGTRVMMHLPLLLSKPYEKEGGTDVENVDRRG
ncbi:cache domain-containing sensor histidine kinase [Paenibacillus lignilyticus]|uniref:histidine kinase n=1 Tax=Paenibacillus lignilyticus TaxID=1172615 RepID=A0ABS5CD55_9BACL|nr:sensor histidine kinase [Paenibacillus lignilyticus]MBP3963043.1 histidine kinase [Paenibacillus lignilyticus]